MRARKCAGVLQKKAHGVPNKAVDDALVGRLRVHTHRWQWTAAAAATAVLVAANDSVLRGGGAHRRGRP